MNSNLEKISFFGRLAKGRVLILLFLIICPGLFAADFPQLDYILDRPPFTILCAHVDSANADKTASILINAYQELAFDFEINSAVHFRVLLMPSRKSFRQALRGELPSWTGAFAVPGHNLMVLKSPRWDQSGDFKQALVHELTHLVVHQVLGARDLPRWLDEGMAIFYSKEERWKTERSVSKALVTGSILPLEDIDDVLDYHRAKADLAYQQSFSAVHYLLITYDVEALKRIVFALRDGASLNTAFVQATGSTFYEFEKEWRRYIEKHYKWFWFYEINEYLWILIILLAIAVLILRKFRNRRIEETWDEASEMDESSEANGE